MNRRRIRPPWRRARKKPEPVEEEELEEPELAPVEAEALLPKVPLDAGALEVPRAGGEASQRLGLPLQVAEGGGEVGGGGQVQDGAVLQRGEEGTAVAHV